MTDSVDPGQLLGDAPLQADAFDAVGLREVAASVAAALAALRTDASLVIGIEGRWGSGKSSLLVEVERALVAVPAAHPHSLVHFRPWLVGNRDALLEQLFDDLERAIAGIEAAHGDTTRQTLVQARRAGKALRSFAAGVKRAGSAVELAGDAAAFAPVKWAGKGVAWVGEWLGREPAVKSLDVLRARLETALKALDHRIIVTIDDIDRLEPTEMLEVLRLVRSVGDLPNILYLLCYDSEILAHGVRQAAQVENGQAYLEKIVQLTVPVPLPETFQLRHWFEVALAGFAVPRDEDGASRLRSVIDFEGGRRLTTPRSVIRVLDALRFLWPTLDKAGADLADLVWLQLIKEGNPALYRWIEEYCATAAELSLGTARVEKEERAITLDALVARAGKEWFASLNYAYYFAEQLPGLDLNYAQEGPRFNVHGRVAERERDRAIAGRRLASPDHYRLYFALAAPTHALQQADFDAFWAAAREGPEVVSQLLVAMQVRPSGRVLSQADMLLERIRGGELTAIDPSHAANILLGFADGLDAVYRARPFERFWVTGPWDRAERLVVPLLARLEDGLRTATVDAMFKGAALSWLTSLFRRETFAHGRFGDRPKPISERYFGETELDRIAATMRARYRALSLDAILGTVSPIDILFAWVQGGDTYETEHVAAFLAAETVGDCQFLRVLDVLRSTVTTSDGQYKTLKLENLKPFLDVDLALERLRGLAGDTDRPDLAQHARNLIDAAEAAREF
ncbi:KAP family P-loop NTPase fold protein [Sphingosinicella xenopeptidilytica]|uniref:P-loop NTPase fold protein n=1 Tax=Sphingosinicella xenopeptidilytica TaxID=364098 RepID=A0ABW3BZQ3_SPHXN